MPVRWPCARRLDWIVGPRYHGCRLPLPDGCAGPVRRSVACPLWWCAVQPTAGVFDSVAGYCRRTLGDWALTALSAGVRTWIAGGLRSASCAEWNRQNSVARVRFGCVSSMCNARLDHVPALCVAQRPHSCLENPRGHCVCVPSMRPRLDDRARGGIDARPARRRRPRGKRRALDGPSAVADRPATRKLFTCARLTAGMHASLLCTPAVCRGQDAA
jgi:hypothetical protein